MSDYTPTTAEVEAVARSIFEARSMTGPRREFLWQDLVREYPQRADVWRSDVRDALRTARDV